MPTGCRSVYLIDSQFRECWHRPLICVLLPACDLEGRAKDLGSHKFCHFETEVQVSGGPERSQGEVRGDLRFVAARVSLVQRAGRKPSGLALAHPALEG